MVSSQEGRAVSKGAVRSILLRWREIGYAMVEGEPLEFVGLTVAGMEFGLDEMYRRAGHERRVSRAERAQE